MKIAVVGTGYVGLVTGVCLSEVGHDVTCIDKDENKINMLSKGKSTIYEENLEDLILKNLNKSLFFTTSIESGINDADAIFIAVGTPPDDNGNADLSYVHQVAIEIGKHISKYAVVITKSTVPVGTSYFIRDIISNLTTKEFDIASNPEFLREGTAVNDTFYADRIIIGTDSSRAKELLENIYKPFNVPILHTDIRSSEMIKYASNAFLATKISFINEIANICENVGADIQLVAQGIGMDKRIGKNFLNAGIGYGGSCFPKDTNALVQIAGNANYDFDLLKSVILVNNKQPEYLIQKAKGYFNELSDRTVAVLGLAFKPNTDDVRESVAVQIIRSLLSLNSRIRVYDPIAMVKFKSFYKISNIEYCTSWQSCVEQADCLFIVTEWQEFLQIDLEELKKLLKYPVIFDGRNCFSLDVMDEHGFNYFSVGRKRVLQEEKNEVNHTNTLSE